jgi:Holliday junction resolvase RusA-like endonuclease
LWINRGNRRVRSPVYRHWLDEAGWRLRLQKVVPVAGPVLIVVGCERQNMAADIDNRMKPLFDLMTKAGVIEDDRLITGFAASWLPKRDGLTHVLLLPVGPRTITFHAVDRSHGSWIFESDPPVSQTEGGHDGHRPAQLAQN